MVLLVPLRILVYKDFSAFEGLCDIEFDLIRNQVRAHQGDVGIKLKV